MPTTTQRKNDDAGILPLHNPRIIDEWRAAIAQDEQTDNGKDARFFVEYYEDYLKKNPTFAAQHPDAAVVYDDLYVRALWLAFSFLNKKEGLAVFEKCIRAAVVMPSIDMWEKVRSWLIQIPLQLRTEAKGKLLAMVQQSTAQITKTPLLIDGQQEVPGTVAAWVQQYLSAAGTDQSNTLARTQFLFANKAFSRLSPEEQTLLRQLFVLVDHLLLPSETAEGFEEDRIAILDDEVIEVEAGEEKKLAEEKKALLQKIHTALRGGSTDQLRARLMGSEEERAAIRRAEESLEKTFGTDAKELRDALFALCERSASGTDWYEAVAVVRALIRCNGFSELLRADTRFADMLRARYEAAGARGLVDDLKVYPTAPQHLAAFSQFLLVEKLGVPSSDAARHLIQWMNMLAKSGAPLFTEPPAYFSEEADAFQFAQPLPAASRGARSV